MESSCGSCSPPPSPQSSDSVQPPLLLCRPPSPLPVLPNEGSHEEAPWDFSVWSESHSTDRTLTDVDVGSEEIDRAELLARKLAPLRQDSPIPSSTDDLWSWDGLDTTGEDEDSVKPSESDEG